MSIASSDAGVRASVDVCVRSTLAGPSRSLLRWGHYASVLHVSGITLSTGGISSKLVVAATRAALVRPGIDCIAMNVNDSSASASARAEPLVDARLHRP